MPAFPRIAIPPEWAPHQVIWTAWPAHPDWGDYLEPAREEIAAMVEALSHGDRVKLLAAPGEPYQSARKRLGGVAEIIEMAYGDTWLRDTGPIFGAIRSAPSPGGSGTTARAQSVAHLFRFNGWGEKYMYEGDAELGEKIAMRAGAEIIRHDFILEGGSIDIDGNGLCLTTRQCLLNPNRNKGWNEKKAEELLREALGVQKVLWLERGLNGDHTDGHIDNIARFVGPSKVVCQHPSGADDPNAEVLKKIEQQLRAMRDWQGKPLEVVTIPSPGRIKGEDAPEMQAASHMNFIIGNKCVVMPAYNERANEAAAALKSLFPGREVVALSARAILTGGGAFHCITQQEPDNS